jgi:hypothetical protein
MSGQNAEPSGEFTSTDSQLDAILEQLNTLGGSPPSVDAPEMGLRSVPDLHAEPAAESVVDEGDPLEQQEPSEPGPSLGLVPPPFEPVVIEHAPIATPAEMTDQFDLGIEPSHHVDETQVEVFAAPAPNVEFETPAEDESLVGVSDWVDVEEDVVQEDSSDTSAHNGLIYESDEDLPLPDFTGVWADNDLAVVWDHESANEAARAIPEPIETGRTGSEISDSRNELESLRPAEGFDITKVPQKLGRQTQIAAVVLFALIALAVILLNEPAVVDELRETYDGFFG